MTTNTQLEVANAQLTEFITLRKNYEATNTQLEAANTQREAANAQLEAVNTQLVTAHTQLDVANAQLTELDTLRKSLDVTNKKKLEAMKQCKEAFVSFLLVYCLYQRTVRVLLQEAVEARDNELEHRKKVIDELKVLIESRPEIHELPDNFGAQIEEHLRHMHRVLTATKHAIEANGKQNGA